MDEMVANLRQRVDAIRKTGKVPHWRMVYAEYLLNRAQEYLAVDREPEAKLVAAKIDRWVVQHTPKPEERSAAELHPMEFWNKDLLAGISSQIKKTLSAKRLLVPSTERDSILRRLDVVEGWIGEGKFLKAHEELLSLRASLIARLRRSYRARLAAASVYQGGTLTLPPGTDSFVSIERAEKLLGFAPRYSNKQALVRNYDWYVEHLSEFKGKTGVSHRVPWKQGLLAFAKLFF